MTLRYAGCLPAARMIDTHPIRERDCVVAERWPDELVLEYVLRDAEALLKLMEAFGPRHNVRYLSFGWNPLPPPTTACRGQKLRRERGSRFSRCLVDLRIR